ncbi:hypothetical protein EYF80_035829 [Liparis tanakae]|uniref:Uncharacterized protein n=1 Tax=Liparis tanakae TaxID=230148 RepID=A0A4Z2GL40_9TELE|nr:hypothetical protein EYF80_035829 [Liparis tanakae]
MRLTRGGKVMQTGLSSHRRRDGALLGEKEPSADQGWESAWRQIIPRLTVYFRVSTGNLQLVLALLYIDTMVPSASFFKLPSSHTRLQEQRGTLHRQSFRGDNLHPRVSTHESPPTSLYPRVSTHESPPTSLHPRVSTSPPPPSSSSSRPFYPSRSRR